MLNQPRLLGINTSSQTQKLQKMNTKSLKYILEWLLFCGALSSFAQTPFQRTGQVFQILADNNELQEFSVLPSANNTSGITLGPLPPGGFDAMGYRRTDNLLYGIGSANNHVYKVGQNADFQDLGAAGLFNTLFYLAGDVSADGRYLYSIGSNAAGTDVHLAKTDLESAALTTQFFTIAGSWHLSDIAYDPNSDILYGFDQLQLRMVTINPNSGAITPLQNISPGNSIQGLYFDAFGDLYGIGSTLSGIVGGYFRVDKSTGADTRLATGGLLVISDAASGPVSVELKSELNPGATLPCSDVLYKYTLVNSSETTFSGLEFLQRLPPGFQLKEVVQNSFGATVDTNSVAGHIRIQPFSLPPGLRVLLLKLSVGDVPKGKHNTQAVIKNLPALYGGVCRSNFEIEPGFEDTTTLVVNRFDEDSLFLRWLICQGSTLVLETTGYGNEVVWNTGSTATAIQVTQGGLYRFVAGNTCEQIVVSNDVTSTTCPFTIAMTHDFLPDSSFACNDLVFRFVIRNDSGEPRYNVAVNNVLPAGFSFVSVQDNPFGGASQVGLPSNEFSIQGMTLKVGIDTLKIRVHVGDVPPGTYKNRAILAGLPPVLGPIRLSDDPNTTLTDSSSLYIKGTFFDTLYLDAKVCEGQPLTLDGSPYGKSFQWDAGDQTPWFTVYQPGTYHVKLLDGCKPAHIFWSVTPGAGVEIGSAGPFLIHQGESVSLAPSVTNQGDSLQWLWSDPLQHTLSCLTCPAPFAMPLETAVYGLKVANEHCFDTAFFLVTVDEARRIYAPTAFSPNGDGENDTFYLQSPDDGQIMVLNIYDRWGNLVFSTDHGSLRGIDASWDGKFLDTPVSPGVYWWMANITFIDGAQHIFSGDVTVVR